MSELMNNMHVLSYNKWSSFKLSSQEYIHTLQKYLCIKADDMMKGKLIQDGHSGYLGNMNNCQNVRKTQRNLNCCWKIWNLGENVKYVI